jgi:hypothetical protein
LDNAPIEDYSTALVVRAVIESIDALKNTEISSTSLNEFKTKIRALANLCNTKYLKNFPIEIIEAPVDTMEFETRSWYSSDLKFSNIKNFIIAAFEQAMRLSDATRCIDALRILINYCNIVVFVQFDYGLEIKQKKLDGCSSNRLVATSIHLVNGDDTCIA